MLESKEPLSPQVSCQEELGAPPPPESQDEMIQRHVRKLAKREGRYMKHDLLSCRLCSGSVRVARSAATRVPATADEEQEKVLSPRAPLSQVWPCQKVQTDQV